MKKTLFLIVFISGLWISHSQLIAAKYDIKSIKANTKYSDYGASFYGPNKVVFASNAKDSKKLFGTLNKVHTSNVQPKFDLYMGYLDNNGEINYVKPLLNQFVTKYNESNVSFTPDLKYVYFTQNNLNKKNKYVTDKNNWVNLKIYRAKVRSNGEWTDVEELPFNSNDYSCAHPSVSEDGRILFFTSDMPGSYGQSDIYWVTVGEDGSIGQPQNLGENVNSRFKENFPYVDGSILYFSSDRPGGNGGLDIYMVSLNKAIGKPVNLETPINSSYDDFCFVIDREKKRGFFSSNRPKGKGQDDIYYFKQTTKIKKCTLFVEGTVSDKEGHHINEARVFLYDADGFPMETVLTDDKGNFVFHPECRDAFKLSAEKKNYVTLNPERIISSDKNHIRHNLILEKKIQNEEKPIISRVEPQPEIAKQEKPLTEEPQEQQEIEKQKKEEEPLTVIRNGKEMLNVPPIYFDVDQSYLTKAARNILDKVIKIMYEHPEIRIEFGAHTDCRASKAYNLHLSQLRAQSVVKYLLSAGISRDRIIGKGYGESQPVNHCVDGVKCTEKEHLQNRRSEFVILH